MKKLITTLSLALLTHLASAATVDTWQGSGVLFDQNGNRISHYVLTVKNTQLSKNKMQSDVTVTQPDGSITQHGCLNTKGAQGWASDCKDGQGGGHCFGEGMCQTYIENAAGRAFATTIAMDGPKQMRLLRTQLENGKAVRFFREKLIRK